MNAHGIDDTHTPPAAPAAPGSDYLLRLNEPQMAAVTHVDGPILVLAGAGSGKTRVLTQRIAHLVLGCGVDPQNILAVTFTNKATEEMRSRLERMLGQTSGRLWIATFHSAALRMLRRNATLMGFTSDFAVYDEDESRSVLKQVLRDMGLDPKKFPPEGFARQIDRAKNHFKLPAEIARETQNLRASDFAEVYDRYQRILRATNAMDFGDLLVNATLMLQQQEGLRQYFQRQLHYVLVDEFQDTNPVQYLFLRLLTQQRRNLFVVGDEDQSIYGFRGADIGNILEFEKDYPGATVVKLEQNYRSTSIILEAAHAVICKNKARKGKHLWTAEKGGELIRSYVASDEGDEARFIAQEISRLVSSKGYRYRDIAIFYRTNAQSRALEEHLLRQSIPYRIFGGLRFFDRKEIRDIVGYLRLILNPLDNQAFQRVVNTPPRGVGEVSIQALSAFATQNNLGLYEAARQTVAQESKKGLRDFVEIIEKLKALAVDASLGALVQNAIQLSEYEARLKLLRDPSAESRIENLRELRSYASGLEAELGNGVEGLRQFLDRIFLASSVENPREGGQAASASQELDPQGRVSLMTLHLAKGLEFSAVFFGGLEEGLLPHYRSLDDPTGIEEERRLCYVGITRARRELCITRAEQRGMFNQGDASGSAWRLVSRFARDIPVELLKEVGQPFTASHRFDDPHSSENWEQESEPQPGLRTPALGPFSRNSALAEKYRVGQSADKFSGLVKPASSLETPERSLEGLVPLEPAMVRSGLRVLHPTMGPGCVEKMEGEPEGPAEKLRIFVRFDSDQVTRKLILKFARLVLEPGA
jgi:DNA helicase-2/ATP-dependent DNA helicase PcrA